MSHDKKSFFDKLTGAMSLKEDSKEESDELALESEESSDGQLSVDVYQTPKEIVIKTMVAGVRPEDLDVTITRDMVTIEGHREDANTTESPDYFHQELYWGSFSRTIILPQEIDTEAVEAIQKQGMLIIRLPKIDRNKQSKVKIKSEGK
ncbi:MAG: Hsp20/alpha crystallin family protein [bacterium]